MPKDILKTFDAPKSNIQYTEGQKSKGILDDYAIRGVINTKEGTIEHTPAAAKDILNKQYGDATYSGVGHTHTTFASIVYFDGAPIGLDVLYSADIGTHLTVGNNLTVGGTAKIDSASVAIMELDGVGDANNYAKVLLTQSGGSHLWEIGHRKNRAHDLDIYYYDGSWNLKIEYDVSESTLNIAGKITCDTDIIINGPGTAWNFSALQLGGDDGRAWKINHRKSGAEVNDLWIEYYDGGWSNVLRYDISASQFLVIDGALVSGTASISASSDTTDVSGINTLFVDVSSATVVLGGLTGGVAGQTLNIVITATGALKALTLEDQEGVSAQDFYMHAGTDESITNELGGFVFVCDGSNWYDCSHAKHV